MKYQFLKTVTVQGVPHAAGELIDESEIPVGSLESLLRDFVVPVAKTSDSTESKFKKKEI